MVNDSRDSDSGKFKEKYDRSDFIETLKKLGGGGTQEVADEIECPYRTAYDRLSKLEEDGRITTHKVGRVNFWEVVKQDN